MSRLAGIADALELTREEAAHYIDRSGDSAILNEMVPFLEGPTLAAGEHDSFFQPTVSDVVVTLFEHCACALDQSVVSGGHGLPLIGTGDWNDGMNRVGERGEGGKCLARLVTVRDAKFIYSCCRCTR